jgi:hypothetical protein
VNQVKLLKDTSDRYYTRNTIKNAPPIFMGWSEIMAARRQDKTRQGTNRNVSNGFLMLVL